MIETSAEHNTRLTRTWIYLALLIFIVGLTIFPFLGLQDFNTKGEPREAVVASTMLETGNWILPRNNGGETAYKPPMLHWCLLLWERSLNIRRAYPQLRLLRSWR